MKSKKPKTSVRASAKTTNRTRTAAGDKARKAASEEIAERIQRLDAETAADGWVGGAAKDAPPAPAATAAPDAAAPKTPKARGRCRRAAHAGTPSGGAKTAKPEKARKVSGLDAAALVLADSNTPMKATDMLAEIQKRGLWASKGKTPEATLYAAIIREIAAKGREARFRKHDRGLFVAASPSAGKEE